MAGASLFRSSMNNVTRIIFWGQRLQGADNVDKIYFIFRLPVCPLFSVLMDALCNAFGTSPLDTFNMFHLSRQSSDSSTWCHRVGRSFPQGRHPCN